MRASKTIRLEFLPMNVGWSFVFGDALLRIGTGPMIYRSRAEAVEHAAGYGILVGPRGAVRVAADDDNQ